MPTDRSDVKDFGELDLKNEKIEIPPPACRIDFPPAAMLGFGMSGPTTTPSAGMTPALSWRSWPLADDAPRSFLLVAVTIGVCVLVGVAFGGIGYGLLAAGMLAVALGRYFLPTRFELSESGVTVRFCGQTRHMDWSDVGRVVVQEAGVFVSPFAAPSRLDSFRGVFVRFVGNGDEVVTFVRQAREQAKQMAETA